MKQDQWFEPGDKVMRVSRIGPDERYKSAPSKYDAKEGVVYCVEQVRISFHENVIMNLIGLPKKYTSDGRLLGFLTSNFRKVEEIKLCVQAAEAMKKEQTKEVKVGLT